MQDQARILVVDDNVDSADMLAYVMQFVEACSTATFSGVQRQQVKVAKRTSPRWPPTSARFAVQQAQQILDDHGLEQMGLESRGLGSLPPHLGAASLLGCQLPARHPRHDQVIPLFGGFLDALLDVGRLRGPCELLLRRGYLALRDTSSR